jgi:hypothetical protein
VHRSIRPALTAVAVLLRNEWGEGSSVEPGVQTLIDAAGREVADPNRALFGNAYVRGLADNLPALELGTGR